MSLSEWLETVVIFVAIWLLWLPILGVEHLAARFSLYGCVPLLVWIVWRRWKRFKTTLSFMSDNRKNPIKNKPESCDNIIFGELTEKK